MNRVGRFKPTITPSPPPFYILLSFYSLLSTFFLTYSNQCLFMPNFPDITISSINCSSLNMSSISSSHHKLKLYGITKLRSDFIFMSDIRLGSKSIGGNSIAVLEKSFLVNPYGAYVLYCNSSKSSRGVGILIKKSLTFSVLAEARDLDENILGLRISISGTELVLISIYGPNSIDNNFFKQLCLILGDLSNIPVIIGGDWNCTYSCNPLNSNPDVCDMAKLPNLTHSKLVRNLCEKFSLSDPFRFFYPNKQDFSFTPCSTAQKNRSRLDYFLISDSIAEHTSDCSICPNLQNSLFDHKAITLSFIKKKSFNRKPCISNFILNDPLIEIVVKLSVIECYTHLAADPPFSQEILLQRVGTAKHSLREIGDDSNILLPNTRTVLEINLRENRIAELKATIDELDIDGLQSLAIVIDDDLFLEYLINNIRNDIVSYQTFIARTFNLTKNTLINQLNICKSQQAFDPDLMRELEQNLNLITDLEVKNEFEKFRNFEILNCEKITPFFIKMANCTKKSSSLAEVKNEGGQGISIKIRA